MSDPQVNREPYMLIVEWEDPVRNAADEDAPFCFGPFATEQEVKAAAEFVKQYQDHDNEPPESRLKCRIGMFKSPQHLRMFLAL